MSLRETRPPPEEVTVYACEKGDYTITVNLYEYSVDEDETYLLDTDDEAITVENTPPAFAPSTYNFEVPERAALGRIVGRVSATDSDNDLLTYSITGGNTGNAFAIGSSAGQITVARALSGLTPPSYSLTVRVDDGDGGQDTARVDIRMNRVPVLPSIAGRTFDVGESVNWQLPIATGGDPQLTYTATGLPPGLSFNNSTRRITGRPTGASSTVTYTVRDADGDTDSETFRINVNKSPVLPNIGDRTYDIGESVNWLLPAATGGDSPLSYSTTGIPAGLSFSSTTRRITGRPTGAGSTVTYTVRDADGDTDSETFRINVNKSPVLPNIGDRTYDIGESVNWLLPAATEGTRRSAIRLPGFLPG